MQLRKMSLMLTVLGAVGMMLTGCGGDEQTLTCSADTDCLESEICHPNAKVCVQTCTAGADCPDTAKTCEALDTSSASSPKICKCSTDALCNTGRETADLTCSSAYKVCVPSGTAGGCTTNADCASGQTCQAGVCKAPTTGSTCSGEGKSTCNYGEYCSSSTCAAVPAPTCDNYQNFTDRTKLGTTGPITFKAVTTSATTDTTWCAGAGTPKRVKVTISAYSNTPFPQDKDQLNGLFWVQVNGSPKSATDIISASAGNYTVTGTNRERADIVLNFCVAADSQTLSTGVYFTGGNFFCYRANY
ncbi:hypothetical protein JRI60_19115 [Archangium violaceum]|uniref:hypothetical protein n=1 Tax=Archangium violaceum TaxID=83451 RepID=UPI0019512B6C|nr:hypothetical protein [Archangium violaceum]QRO00990.1 hypothetical protein JRI60_19115 [Archangium violaceum]